MTHSGQLTADQKLWVASLAAGNGQPPGVKFYVHTDDPQGTLAKVESSGGKILMPLTEVAPETNIALFADPEGHVIGIM